MGIRSRASAARSDEGGNAGRFPADKNHVALAEDKVPHVRLALRREEHESARCAARASFRTSPRSRESRSRPRRDSPFRRAETGCRPMRKPAGSMIAASTPRQAQVRIIAPAFWAMSGSYRARRSGAFGGIMASVALIAAVKKRKAPPTLASDRELDQKPRSAAIAAMDNQKDRCEKPRRLRAEAARRRPIRRRVSRRNRRRPDQRPRL